MLGNWFVGFGALVFEDVIMEFEMSFDPEGMGSHVGATLVQMLPRLFPAELHFMSFRRNVVTDKMFSFDKRFIWIM